MAKIQINKKLTVAGVADIPSGSYVRIQVSFDKYLEKAYMNYTLYKNITNYNSRVEVTGNIDGLQMYNRIVDIPNGTIPTLEWVLNAAVTDINSKTQLDGDYAVIVE